MSSDSINKRSSSVCSSQPVKKTKVPIDIVERVARTMSSWSPLDDYSLITSFVHCRNPQLVHSLMPFCSHRTLGEIKDRWQCILRDKQFCQFVTERIQDLPTAALLSVLSKIPLNQREQSIVADIPCHKDNIGSFARVLKKYPDVFLFSRTANQLRNHWRKLRKYMLLRRQKVDFTRSDSVTSSVDISPADSANTPIKSVDELTQDRAKISQRARELEREIAIAIHQLWLRTHDSTDFRPDVLAMLEDQHGTQYLIKDNKVIFGRGTAEQEVDVDLRISGAGLEVSRLQGLIQLDIFESVFYCCNIGSRVFYVNGIPVQPREKCRLDNNCLVEVADIELLFTINITYVTDDRFSRSTT